MENTKKRSFEMENTRRMIKAAREWPHPGSIVKAFEDGSLSGYTVDTESIRKVSFEKINIRSEGGVGDRITLGWSGGRRPGFSASSSIYNGHGWDRGFKRSKNFGQVLEFIKKAEGRINEASMAEKNVTADQIDSMAAIINEGGN